MIDTLIRTSALFALVAIATFALRNRSSGLRYMLWSFAIVGAVFMPALTKVAPFQWRVLPASAPALSSVKTLPNAKIKSDEGPVTTQAPAALDESNAPVIGQAIANESSLLDGIDLAKALMILWITGALILITRLVVGLVTVNRIAGRATEITDDAWRTLTDRAIRALDVRVPVEVRRSDEVAMPFATGLVRPVVVLPANTDTWNTQQREAVLLHELAHISRGDLAMNILSHVMRAAYWVNPLAWLAAHRLRVEGEKAADDAVLRGGARASDYADHLLSIVRTVGNTVPNVALAMARRSDFEGRLLAILEPGVPRGRLSRVRAFALAALFVTATLPLAAMTRVGAAAPPENELVLKVGELPLETSAPQSNQPNTTPLPQASAPITALAATLSDDQVSVRLAAVQSLGNLQDPAAIAALAKALKEDTDARVREAAAGALGEIDDNRAVPHLIEALRNEKVTRVKIRIVDAMREIDDPSAVQAVIGVIRDPSAEVRRSAASALAEFEDAAGRTALLTMTKDEDVQVRREVAQHIGDLETTGALQALLELTADADDEVRASAIEQLHHFESDRRVVTYLVRALGDKSPHVRQHAADGIGNFHEQLKGSAPDALIAALQDQNRDVRRSAANSLGNIGDEAAVPALKRLVSDTDVETRRHAVEALKEIGGADAIQALMGLLKDPDPEVRKTAAEALGKRRGG